MVRIIIAAVLGVGAIIAYAAGAKTRKSWPKGVALVLLLATGAAALLGQQPFQLSTSDDPAPESSMDALRLLGEGLRGHLSEDARVVVIREPADTEEFDPDAEIPMPFGHMPTDQVEAIEKALAEGAGVHVNVVACLPTRTGYRTGLDRPGDAVAFSKLLHSFSHVDAWISLAGLPVDLLGKGELTDVVPPPESGTPLVAACVLRRRRPRELQRWLSGGQLQAAVLCDLPGCRSPALVTREDMSALFAKPDQPDGAE